MRYIITVAVFLLGSIVSFSQSNFLPGVLMLNDSSRVEGFIDYRNWNKNPDHIWFKKTDKDAAAKHSLNDISGFEVLGKDRYERAYVSIDTRPTEINDVRVNQSDTGKTTAVFLRVIVKGHPFSLYEYNNSRSHYFIQREGQEILELTYFRFTTMDSWPTVFTNYTFRSQLRKELDAQVGKELLKKLDGLNYEEYELRPFVAKMNSRQDFDAADALKGRKFFKVFAGVGIKNESFHFVYNDLNELQFDAINSLTGMAGVDFMAFRDQQKSIFRFQVAYNALNAHGVSEDLHREYSFRQTNIEGSFAALYRFFKAGPVRFYLGGTAGYTLSYYSKNTYIFFDPLDGHKENLQPYNFAKDWTVFYLNGGITIGEAFDIGVADVIGGSFDGNVNFKSWSLRALYRF